MGNLPETRLIKILVADKKNEEFMPILNQLPKAGPAAFEFECLKHIEEVLQRSKVSQYHICLINLDLADQNEINALRTIRRETQLPVIVLIEHKDYRINRTQR
jgi:CheY-like chemotaxis protein